MNLLEKGLLEKSVIETRMNKKLVIDNLTNNYPVYKIQLSKLYYNDQNDRIATWLAQYKSDNKIDSMRDISQDDYNKIIHGLITESNPTSLKKTQQNIELVGQQEAGVVLMDGRVIDGNRRFTCLRNLEQKTGKTQYFEAVILDRSIENNAKQIKMLELMLQHGVDEKIDYAPIDRLVGIYTDIIETKLLTAKEYANSVNLSENDIQVEIEKANLMIEFLEFINAPKQFHIARQFNVVDPLKELYMMLKKVKSDEQREQLKNIVFAQLIYQPFGDMTRHIRKIKKISSNSLFFNDFLEEQVQIVERVCDVFEQYPQVTSKEINIIRNDDKLKNDFSRSTDKFVSRVDSDETRNQPIKIAEKALDRLASIDTNIFKKMSEEQRFEINDTLDSIDQIVLKLREELDV